MTKIQGLLIIGLILVIFFSVIAFIANKSFGGEQNITVADCSQMYNNETLMEICYSKFGSEIDP